MVENQMVTTTKINQCITRRCSGILHACDESAFCSDFMHVKSAELQPVGCVARPSLILFFSLKFSVLWQIVLSGLSQTVVSILCRPGFRTQLRHTVLGKHISSACLFPHCLVTLIGCGSISSYLRYHSK